MISLNLYDQLNSMTKIDNAFEKWTDYREEVTEYIAAHTFPKSSITILGAGRCNDIDIRYLSQKGYRITLVDRDENALNDAIDFYNVKADKIVCDFTGIEDNTYRELADYIGRLIFNSTAKEELNRLVINKMFEIYDDAASKGLCLPVNKSDYIICAGVCSQINNMAAWIWEAYAAQMNIESSNVLKFISDNNYRIIEHFIMNILSITANSAIFINELQREGLDDYIEGAYQAIELIRSKYDNQITDKETMIWKFSEDIVYKMLVQNVQTKI